MAQDFDQPQFDGYPLGFRNNNPGNLRTGISWQGATGENKGFVVFENMAYGIRAAGTVLINNISSEGNDTIRKLITKYAPPSENNTDAYINAVSGSTGIDPDATLDTSNDTITAMLHAIFEHENGATYAAKLTDDDINEGLSMLAPKWLMKIQNFFADNPTVVEAGGWGLLIVAAIVIAYFFRNSIKKLIA